MQKDNSTDAGADGSSRVPGSTRLRGGLVGFGRMGLTHFAIVNTHPEVELCAICDESAFMRSNIDRYMSAEAFADYQAMLEKVQLDFLIVATPTGAHAEVVQRALDHGLHVFVEKPLSLSPADGERLAVSAGRKGLVNQVGYVVRFNDVMMQVKRLLEARALGELVHYKVEMYGSTVLREPTSWRARKADGGGCLYDFASHSVDLCNYLFGTDAEPCGSIMQRIYSRDAEDAIYTNLVHAGGLR